MQNCGSKQKRNKSNVCKLPSSVSTKSSLELYITECVDEHVKKRLIKTDISN
jgi:hypothetical protein